MVIISNPFNL